MNKRGLGHVEVILAFVLFASAVFFIFYFIDIRGATKDDQALVSYVSSQIAKKVTSEVIIYSVALNDVALRTRGQSIVVIELPEAVPNDFELRAENYSGSRLPGAISGDRKFAYIDLQNQNLNFIRLLFSVGIIKNEDTTSPPTHDSSLYTIASRQTAFLPSEQKLKRARDDYISNYALLKRQFNIASGNNFDFYIKFSGEDFINAQSDIPARAEVTAKSSRSEIIRGTGEIAFAESIIRVW